MDLETCAKIIEAMRTVLLDYESFRAAASATMFDWWDGKVGAQRDAIRMVERMRDESGS